MWSSHTSHPEPCSNKHTAGDIADNTRQRVSAYQVKQAAEYAGAKRRYDALKCPICHQNAPPVVNGAHVSHCHNTPPITSSAKPINARTIAPAMSQSASQLSSLTGRQSGGT